MCSIKMFFLLRSAMYIIGSIFILFFSAILISRSLNVIARILLFLKRKKIKLYVFGWGCYFHSQHC